MSLLHYIDNEVPAYGEWDSVVEVGSSTITQTADAAFPERPSTGSGFGLRSTIAASGSPAYASKVFSQSLQPGGWIYYGQWMRVNTWGTDFPANFIGMFRDAAGAVGSYLVITNAGPLYFGVYNDGGAFSSTGYVGSSVPGRWYYVVVGIKRATGVAANDGEGKLYQNGSLIGSVSGVDNYDRWSSATGLKFGETYVGSTGFVLDFDEIKIATTYPEPFVPTPTDEYPEARRTVVLYREASADSREFADYCVSELDVPRCNLCPLPNATANETLADYATFETEVEDDLNAWLTLNPTVAANCSCFLIGHGVPGYFTHSGTKHSAVSRLMNLATAFSSQTDNPLYNPATVARLTKAALGGKYLCTRIDADTLQHSKDIIDAGLVVSGLTVLPAIDKLYSDDTDYIASLACQHLRIITSIYTLAFEDDAFVWGDTGMTGFGSAGTRAAFMDDSADSADTLRATSDLFDAIITNGYAAGLGFSADGCPLDAECFFEMLRIGGTLAEAFAVAISKLDYTAVGVGLPLTTVAFQLGGYNVYRGLGGIEGIDWDNPVAYLRAGQDSITFDQDLFPGRSYIYAVRSVSSAGVEERNTHIITYVEPDEQGALLPAPLARPSDLTADVQQSGLLLGFSYFTPVGFSDADGFDILSDNGTGQLDLDNPVATVERSRNDRFDFEVFIGRPDTPVLLAVRPRQGQHTGPISEILFVPLISAPAPAQIL